MHFLEKLADIENKYEELTARLGDPKVLADAALYPKTAKAHSELREIVEKYRQWKEIHKGLSETKTLLEESTSDPAMGALAQEELESLEKRRADAELELKTLLLPKDPNDEKNVVLEIRAGTGGDEATLFAQEVFRMYSRYAETQGWKVDVLSTSLSGVGGLKEAFAVIEGHGVYSKLKYESGVHRAHPHIRRVRRGAPRGRRGGSGNRSQGHPHRYLLFFGPGRTVRKHHIFRCAHYPPADRYGCLLPG
jgi:peptide chain release factor 1